MKYPHILKRDEIITLTDVQDIQVKVVIFLLSLVTENDQKIPFWELGVGLKKHNESECLFFRSDTGYVLIFNYLFYYHLFEDL